MSAWSSPPHPLRDARDRDGDHPAAPWPPSRQDRAAALLSGLGARLKAVTGRLALIYFCLAASTVITLAWLMPPFQNPDELAHFQRIDQLSRGGVIGHRFGRGYSGGAVDAHIEQAHAPFALLPFHPERKVSSDMLARAERLGWGGEPTLNQFPNTSIYSPFCYLPAVAVVTVGKLAGLPLVETLRLTRVVNGLVAVSIATAAIAIAGAPAPLLFAVLTLPMALGQMAAVSQDGLILALTALAVAMVTRGLGLGGWSRGALTALCVCLAVVCAARPPYAPLALTILALPGVAWRRRLVGAGAIVGIVAGWSLLAATLAQVVIDQPDVFPNPAAQLQRLLEAPGQVLPIAVNTLSRYASSYAEQFVGTLGWFDVILPRWLHGAAALSLGLALLATLGGRLPADAASSPAAPLAAPLAAPSAVARVRAAAAAGILLAGAAIFAIQYLTWTDVGGPVVLGVQGRYFLPLALMCGLVALPVARRLPCAAAQAATRLVVAGLPFLFVPTMIGHIVERYYLQPEQIRVQVVDRADGLFQPGGSLDIVSMDSAPPGTPATLVLSGWAKLSMDDPTHSLTLIAPPGTTVVSAISLRRPDVAAFFKDPALLWSGFQITVTMLPRSESDPALCILSDDAQFGRFVLATPADPTTGKAPCAAMTR